jgi:hypothetical protein
LSAICVEGRHRETEQALFGEKPGK